MQIHGFVRSNGMPVIGASVGFLITRPNGSPTTVNAISGSDGYARTTYKITKAKSSLGTYTVVGTWSQSNVTSSDGTVFEVR